MEIPLIYEGLHEIFIYCGDESHKLDTCPNCPKARAYEIVVGKFSLKPHQNTDVPEQPLSGD